MAQGPGVTAVVAGGCLVVGAVLVAVAVVVRRPQPQAQAQPQAEPQPQRPQPRARRRPAPARASVVLSATVLALAAVAVVVASTSSQLAQRYRPPVPGWADERAVVEAWGRAVTDPHRIASSPGRGPRRDGEEPRYTVGVRLERVSARGRTVAAATPVLVIGGGEWGGLSAGSRLALTARLEAAPPGDDVVAVARALGPPREVASGGRVWRVADRLRAGLRDACAGLPADAGGLLPSLAVGDTSRLSDQLRTELQTAGLTHLTAVSGANLAIVAGAVLWLGTRSGAPRGARLAVALGIVVGFVVVARPQPSVLRAAAMGTVALLGLGLSRRPRGVPALAAAGIVLLVVDPWLARSAGFALSCAATSALLLLAPAWTRRWSRRLPRPLAAALAVPSAAQAVCGPLVVLLTPSVSLVAVPANLLAEPAVAPATVAGVVAAAVAPLWPTAAHAIAVLGSFATWWIVQVARTAAALPFAALGWPAGVGGALLLAALTAVVVAASLVPPPGRRSAVRSRDAAGQGVGHDARQGVGHDAAGRRPPRRTVVVVLVALLAAAAVGWTAGNLLPGTEEGWSARGAPPGWAVAQCDVGQGSATAVRSGPDRALLLDAGPFPDAVDRCLRRLGVRHLDLVVLTHHHADHVQGLPGALRHRDVGRLLVSPLAEPRPQAREVAREAASAGVQVEQGWAGLSGESAAGGWQVRWQLLAPVDPPAEPAPGEDGDGTVVNESSLVTVVEVGGPSGTLRVLSLGDLEIEGQRRLLDRLRGPAPAVATVDVLVVAHHGSARQEPGLCPAVAPRVALIGVGADNDYGHPAPSALAALADCGVLVRRTDLEGSIAVAPAPDGRLTVRSDRRAG